MVEIATRPLTADNAGDLNCFESSFTVISELALRATHHRISYEVRPVLPWVKRYARDDDPRDYIDRPDRAGWLAYAAGEVVGQILVGRHWNRLAYVSDIAVHPDWRRRGVGGQLMQRTIAWARSRDLAGIMVETQNVNVPACRFYESQGFVLRGFDAGLYRGVEPGTREIALFYYLLF
ncbi:MAG: GNAT family N-acetyltransferase [Anaerolineae bacterium]